MINKERIKRALNGFHFYSGIRLDSLPVNELAIFNKRAKINLKKKKVLFRQGSYPNGVYILKSGKLKVNQLNYDGSIQILFIYATGEVFGYRPILSNEYQPVSIAALEDCWLLLHHKLF